MEGQPCEHGGRGGGACANEPGAAGSLTDAPGAPGRFTDAETARTQPGTDSALEPQTETTLQMPRFRDAGPQNSWGVEGRGEHPSVVSSRQVCGDLWRQPQQDAPLPFSGLSYPASSFPSRPVRSDSGCYFSRAWVSSPTGSSSVTPGPAMPSGVLALCRVCVPWLGGSLGPHGRSSPPRRGWPTHCWPSPQAPSSLQDGGVSSALQYLWAALAAGLCTLGFPLSSVAASPIFQVISPKPAFTGPVAS